MIAKRSALANALRTAALKYDEDARISVNGGFMRVARSFENRAREARKLADEIEQADTVTIRLED